MSAGIDGTAGRGFTLLGGLSLNNPPHGAGLRIVEVLRWERRAGGVRSRLGYGASALATENPPIPSETPEGSTQPVSDPP
jgi:hypothetical protein